MFGVVGSGVDSLPMTTTATILRRELWRQEQDEKRRNQE